MSVQPLFTPVRMGDLSLPNRIVMAPLRRMRAGSSDHVPTSLQAEYYAQRASTGLIIAEATAISPDGFGWADTPGLWNAKQVRGWRRVTDAVHTAGGRIIALMGTTTDFTGTSLESLMGDGMFRHFRPIFPGKLIANVKMTVERGNRLIADGIADMIAFGRPYIANPDPVERLATGAPLSEIDWKTVYASGPRGYSDYPTLRHAMA